MYILDRKSCLPDLYFRLIGSPLIRSRVLILLKKPFSSTARTPLVVTIIRYVLYANLIGGLALSVQAVSSPQTDPFQVALLLRDAREYSRHLESAALDFVCAEHVQETVEPFPKGGRAPASLVPQNLEINPVSNRPGGMTLIHSLEVRARAENRYVFDYQFTREPSGLKERRVLLFKNGKKVKRGGSPPETMAFKYKDILLAPVELLDEKYAPSYTYRISEDLARPDSGGSAVVLEAVPRPDAFPRRLGGRVWVRREDSCVLRIEWDPSTFDNYDIIMARAKLLEAEPRVTSYTEYGFEKNGLRFPSVDHTEEAYVLKDGKTFVRARTRIEYRDYKFFVVETRSELKK